MTITYQHFKCIKKYKLFFDGFLALSKLDFYKSRRWKRTLINSLNRKTKKLKKQCDQRYLHMLLNDVPRYKGWCSRKNSHHRLNNHSCKNNFSKQKRKHLTTVRLCRSNTSNIVTERLAEGGLVNEIPVMNPKYLLPSQWIPVLLAATYSLPLRSPIPVHITQKGWHRTYPICDAPLSRSTSLSITTRCIIPGRSTHLETIYVLKIKHFQTDLGAP